MQNPKHIYILSLKQFEDIKGVIRIRKSKLMRVLISYVVAIVVFTFLSVSTAKLHLMVEQEQLTLSEL
jgi:hypothetical protein